MSFEVQQFLILQNLSIFLGVISKTPVPNQGHRDLHFFSGSFIVLTITFRYLINSRLILCIVRGEAWVQIHFLLAGV